MQLVIANQFRVRHSLVGVVCQSNHQWATVAPKHLITNHHINYMREEPLRHHEIIQSPEEKEM